MTAQMDWELTRLSQVNIPICEWLLYLAAKQQLCYQDLSWTLGTILRHLPSLLPPASCSGTADVLNGFLFLFFGVLRV